MGSPEARVELDDIRDPGPRARTSVASLPDMRVRRARGRTTTADRLDQYARLLQVTRTLASELDLPDISHQILQCAIDLVAAEAGTLYLYDASTGRLHVQDCIGLGPSIHQLSLEPGECAAGKAFFTGRGEIFNDHESQRQVLSNASKQNAEAFRQATQGLRAPEAAMSAPLIFKGDIVGALVVDKLCGRNRLFDEEDLRLLEDLAQIAAIGIMNARLFDLERSTRLRLQVMNDELNRQRDLLDRRVRALDSMANVAREGFSLEAVAGRLASLACGRTLVLDGLGRVLATAPTGLCPAIVAERSQERDVTELVERVNSDRQRHTCNDGEHMLIASPITAELDVLGYVVLELTDPAPDGVPEALVDSAALIASAVLVRDQAREEGTLQRREDLLSRLLNGDVPKSAAQFQELRPPLRLAVGSVRCITQSRSAGARQAGLVRELKAMTVEAVREQCLSAAIAVRDDHVVVAWSVSGARRAPDEAAMFRRIVEQLNVADEWCARFTLTQTVADPQDVPDAYHEAVLALDIRPWGPDPVIEVGSLGAYRFIIAASSSADALASSRRTLSAVIEHEKRRGPGLLSTLRTYFALGMSVTATANALHIHVHTVQYRLAKIEKLTRLNLRDCEDRLTLELSLRVHDLALARSLEPIDPANSNDARVARDERSATKW